MRSRITTLALAAILVVPGLALAQQHREQRQEAKMQMGEEHTMHGVGMMGMMAGPSPTVLLQQKDALELDDSQAERLKALEKELKEVHEAHMKSVMPLRTEVTEALKGDKPDLARYEAALKKLADPHIQMQVEMARFSQKAMDVLTAEQRANVRYGMRLMHGSMGSSGMMESQGCPMMGGQRTHSK